MCKIILFTNTAKVKALPEFIDLMRTLLADQKDGFGYAIQNSDNSVYGGRTLRPNAPMNQNPIPWCESYSESFGVPGPNTKGALFHGRISTNNVSLLNTHPISKEDWHLIHNGVVQDQEEGAALKPRLTSNDTEFVLDHLMSGGVQAVAEHLTGYYAVGAFSPDGAMHIFRDKTANLKCAYSSKIESYIFATNEDLIERIGEELDEKLWPSSVQDDTYIKFVDGKAVEQTKFISRGYSWNEAQHASKSLGFALDTPSYTPSYKADAYQNYLDMDKETAKNMALLDQLSDEFLDLLENIDDSYRITDAKGRTLTAMEFSKMKLTSQIKCFIVDQNGKNIRKFLKKGKKEVYSYGKCKAI